MIRKDRLDWIESFIGDFTAETGYYPTAEWIALYTSPRISNALVNMDLRVLRQQGRVTMRKELDSDHPCGHVYYYTTAQARAVLEAQA